MNLSNGVVRVVRFSAEFVFLARGPESLNDEKPNHFETKRKNEKNWVRPIIAGYVNDVAIRFAAEVLRRSGS